MLKMCLFEKHSQLKAEPFFCEKKFFLMTFKTMYFMLGNMFKTIQNLSKLYPMIQFLKLVANRSKTFQHFNFNSLSLPRSVEYSY